MNIHGNKQWYSPYLECKDVFSCLWSISPSSQLVFLHVSPPSHLSLGSYGGKWNAAAKQNDNCCSIINYHKARMANCRSSTYSNETGSVQETSSVQEGQGHNIMFQDARTCLTWGICKQNMNTILWNKQVTARLTLAHRRLDKQTNKQTRLKW